MKHIKTPLTEEVIASLKAGDEVMLTGVIYTARDQAHLRMRDIIGRKEELPVDLKGQVIFYCGPAPAKEGMPIGSCGPTTSGRMDPFTPMLLERGVKATIGKGRRSPEVRQALKKHKAVYLIAPGGAGAFLSSKVEKCEQAAFNDLGPEAVYKLTVRDFPLVVGIDSYGKDIYEH